MTGEKLFVLENLKFLLKEFQFVMSLKIWGSMAYTAYHASIPSDIIVADIPLKLSVRCHPD